MRFATFGALAAGLLSACGGSSTGSPGAALATHAGVEAEPNGTLAAANDGLGLAKDGWISASIGTVGDVDLYRVAVPAGPSVVLVASTLDSRRQVCVGIDTVVELLDAAGRVVLRSDDDGPGLCGRLAMVVAPGAWFVRVSAFVPQDRFDYALHLELGTPGLEREPNDTAADALSFEGLASDGQVRGSVDSSADVDLFRLDLPRGGVARVSIDDKAGRCAGAVPRLEVVSAAGVAVPVAAGCAEQRLDLDPGTWFLKVSAPGALGATEYLLEAKAVALGEVEPNQSLADATDWAGGSVPAPGGGRMLLARLGRGDVDVFLLHVATGPATQVTARLRDETGTSCDGLPAEVDLLDAAGAVLATSEPTSPVTCTDVSLLAPPGAIYARVRPRAGATAFVYSLHVLATPVASDERGANDTLATAGAVGTGTSVIGLMSPLEDVDYWSFEVPGGGEIMVAQALTPGSYTVVLDAQVTILDASGAVLADNVGQPYVQVRAWAATEGTYYVRVQASSSATAPFAYELQAFAYRPVYTEQEPNGTLPQASPLDFAVFAPNSGAILPEGDVDLWSFENPGPTLLSFDTALGDSGSCGQSAASLELLDTSMTVLTASTGAPATRSCPRVSALLPPGGYALRVRAAAGVPTFAYDLLPHVQAFIPQEVEPNGLPETASDYASLGAGGPVLGGVWPAGDVDLWRVTAASAGWASTAVLDPSGSYCASEAARTRILDMAGNELVSPYLYYCGGVYVYLQAGTYFVAVDSATPGETFGYRLSVTMP